NHDISYVVLGLPFSCKPHKLTEEARLHALSGELRDALPKAVFDGYTPVSVRISKMVYAVVPIQPNEDQKLALEKKLRDLAVRRVDTVALTQPVVLYDEVAPSIYFMTYHGTSRDLSKEIGFGEDLGVGSGIVMGVSNYFGYSNKTLWEWLRVHNADT
ncbi:MAG: hypothetical protein OXM61_16630, partial [Candidatus Poribacteria bacterium]|nr:hypothetical protein [Candidatus Poribacteria bacterium]